MAPQPKLKRKPAAGPKLPPLLMAAEQGDVIALKRLLRGGEDIKQTADPRKFPRCPGADALILASRNGHAQAVEVLLAAGADVSFEAAYGSALDEATTNGHTEAVRLLLRAGARNFGGGLFNALNNHHLETIRAVADAKIPLAGYRGRCKESLLERAIERRDNAAVSLLIEVGTKPVRDGSLATAACKGDAELTERLLHLGADPNAPGGALKRLPLCEASCSGDLRTIQVLIDKGADPAAVDARGWTCLDWAKYGNKPKAVRWLKDYATKAGIKIPRGGM